MKPFEWMIAVVLVIIGLSCLTMSATWMINPESIQVYLATLLQICMWIGIPILAATILYLLSKWFKGNNKNG